MMVRMRFRNWKRSGLVVYASGDWCVGWKGAGGALVDKGLIFRLSEQGLEEMRIGGRSGTVL